MEKVELSEQIICGTDIQQQKYYVLVKHDGKLDSKIIKTMLCNNVNVNGFFKDMYDYYIAFWKVLERDWESNIFNHMTLHVNFTNNDEWKEHYIKNDTAFDYLSKRKSGVFHQCKNWLRTKKSKVTQEMIQEIKKEYDIDIDMSSGVSARYYRKFDSLIYWDDECNEKLKGTYNVDCVHHPEANTYEVDDNHLLIVYHYDLYNFPGENIEIMKSDITTYRSYVANCVKQSIIKPCDEKTDLVNKILELDSRKEIIDLLRSTLINLSYSPREKVLYFK